MRVLLASGAEALTGALIDAPSLDVVGAAHPDAEVRARLARGGRVATAARLAYLCAQTEADLLVLAGADAAAALADVDAALARASFLSAIGAADARRAALQAGGRVLAPALHRSPYRLLRASLDAGRIGSARFLRWTRWESPDNAGGLAGLLTDELAAVIDLMGRPPLRAYAASHTLRAAQADYLAATLTFERGLTAVIDVGAASAGGPSFDRAMLIGANGSVHADGGATAALRLSDDAAALLPTDGPFDGHVRALHALARGESLDDTLAAHAAAAADAVLASLAAGTVTDVEPPTQ